MAQQSLRAAFMRGGTSKGLMLHAGDLPANRDDWAAVLCGAMGSPDEYGRQLNGMGGGISSLSKVCVVSPSTRGDADVDYTFVQVMITEGRVEYHSNCGNMSSAVGPFALDEGLVASDDDRCVVRIHNTNTNKIIRSTFEVEDSQARYHGDFVIPGVSGTGSPIRLDFLDPGGATTSKLLPTGNVADWIDVRGHGPIKVSMVDAANATVFVRARDVGLTGTESPTQMETRHDALTLLESLRREASVLMGIAPDVAAAAKISSVPFVAIVSEAPTNSSSSVDGVAAQETHLVVRVISNGQPHRALPLTVSLCTAVAARLSGSVVATCVALPIEGSLRLAMPSGVLEVDADVQLVDGQWVARSGTFFRTARRLFDGRVYIAS